MTDLKACPFCNSSGNLVLMRKDRYNVAILCAVQSLLGCGVRGPYRQTPEDAAEAWNTRAEPNGGEAVAEMVYFRRNGSVFEDCLPALPGQGSNYVRGDLITRIAPLYTQRVQAKS